MWSYPHWDLLLSSVGLRSVHKWLVYMELADAVGEVEGVENAAGMGLAILVEKDQSSTAHTSYR